MGSGVVYKRHDVVNRNFKMESPPPVLETSSSRADIHDVDVFLQPSI